MSHTSTHALTRKRVGSNRLIMGFLAAVMAVVVGATGVAQAAPDGKPSKEKCAELGFSNYGKCVSEWAKSHGGGGYGGNTNIDINIDLTVIGNNNVIIIRLFS